MDGTKPGVMRAALMFLQAPHTCPERVALWLADASMAEGQPVVWPEHDKGAYGRTQLRVGGLDVRFALYRDRKSAEAPDDLSHLPDVGETFFCDLTGIAAVLLIELHPGDGLPGVTAERLLAWTAYQAASGLEADFIHWRTPNVRFGADEMLAAALPVADSVVPIVGPRPRAEDWARLAAEAAIPAIEDLPSLVAPAKPAAKLPRNRLTHGFAHRMPRPDVDRLDAELRAAFGRRQPVSAKAGTETRKTGLFGLVRRALPPVFNTAS